MSDMSEVYMMTFQLLSFWWLLCMKCVDWNEYV
jgi:hypothetical protein